MLLALRATPPLRSGAHSAFQMAKIVIANIRCPRLVFGNPIIAANWTLIFRNPLRSRIRNSQLLFAYHSPILLPWAANDPPQPACVSQARSAAAASPLCHLRTRLASNTASAVVRNTGTYTGCRCISCSEVAGIANSLKRTSRQHFRRG